ncbi:hypothetical protein ABZ819_05195 [Streptomyces venezuelae]|uniref:hypothetical protein n=1 Tax=Streptomyces venezuelae TaxID=54571 RepID=UPI0034403BEF
MQNVIKDRLKAEALDGAHWLAVAAVLVGTLFGLDAAFGHSRAPLTVTSVFVVSIGMALFTSSLLNVAFADLRERLYSRVESGGEQA